MLKPTDLGLPQKFSDWRSEQYRAFVGAAGCDKYAYLIDAPTGIGKSLVAAAIQKLHGKTHVYLVNTKQLQDQILKDFPYAKTMKGRVNYPCARFPKQFPEVTANDCTSTTNFPCELREACPYIRAKMVALHAELAVLNYTYFLYECNFVGGEDRQSFSNIGPVICDEVDALEDELMSYTSLTVTAKQLEHLGIEPPRYKTKFESWRDWANPSLDKVAHSIEELESTVCNPSGWGVYDTSAMRKLSAFRRLAGKLDFFIREVNDTWVWYPGEDLWEFKPVWISKYADGVMWRHVPRMYGMSATILDPRQLDRNIGLTNVNLNRYYDYICMSSPFSKECRPVYYQPVANITNKTLKEEIPKLLRAIDSILSKHSDDKVLIHTVSYQIAKYILDNSSYRKRLRSHNTFNRAQVLDEFKRSNYPLVLVSPSMDRGVDLPNDECRAVIIAKVPFPYLGDPQIAKRLYSSKDGRQWYAHRTVSTIIQMAGRGVRSIDDYASCVAPDTKILTSELRWVLASHLKENEGVLCFDEQPIGLGKKNTRYWRRGIVLATGLRAIPCYKLTLADNTVLICTYNHKWLVRRLNSSVWEETKNLTVGSELLRYIRPWVTGTSYTHGWVSGFADGEGTYSAGLGKRNPNVNHIVISQNEGPELDNLRRALGELSFAYSCTPNGTGVHLYVNGGLEEKLRFLGEIRPGRLLRKFYDSNFSSMLRAMDTVNVECIEYIGSQEVVTLQVDRGTYFAEGFGAHNTYILDEQFGRLYSENRRLFPSWFAEAIVE